MFMPSWVLNLKYYTIRVARNFSFQLWWRVVWGPLASSSGPQAIFQESKSIHVGINLRIPYIPLLIQSDPIWLIYGTIQARI